MDRTDRCHTPGHGRQGGEAWACQSDIQADPEGRGTVGPCTKAAGKRAGPEGHGVAEKKVGAGADILGTWSGQALRDFGGGAADDDDKNCMHVCQLLL